VLLLLDKNHLDFSALASVDGFPVAALTSHFVDPQSGDFLWLPAKKFNLS
jgi:hypothetical protein